MGLFTRKNRSASTASSGGGGGSSALSGMKFKGGPGSNSARPARPAWNTSIPPERNGSTGGIAFLDCRMALLPPKELGYLLMALQRARLRPVLVPSVMKIVAGVLKQSGKWGVMNDKSILEGHLKAALDAANAPEDVVAGLNPGLDLYWLEEKRYALPETVEEGVWKALVDGVDGRPEGSVLAKAGKEGNQPPEAAKQTADRLTITHEIVTVCRHTPSPHLLFTSDDVVETAVVKDLGGPDLASRSFAMGKTSSVGWNAAGAEQAVTELLNKAKCLNKDQQAPVTVPTATSGLASSPNNSMSVSPETWRRPGGDDFNDPYDVPPDAPN